MGPSLSIRIAGTAILFGVGAAHIACVAPPPPALYMYTPSPESAATLFYRDGTPYYLLASDDIAMLASFQVDIFADALYGVLWVSYANLGDQELHISPMEVGSLRLSRELDGREWGLSPRRPTLVEHDVASAIAREQSLVMLNAALQLWGEQDPAGRELISLNHRLDQMELEAWGESLRNKKISGALRSHTLFPEEAVHGLVYFKIPYFEVFPSAKLPVHARDSEDVKYELRLMHPGSGKVWTLPLARRMKD